MKKNLLIWLVLSIIVVISNNILFYEVQEFFRYGHEIGKILSNLSLAYISSYIFYLVLVVPKEQRDKMNISQSIYTLTHQLIGRADAVYNFILSGSGVDKEKYNKKTITKEEFKNLCSKVDPRKIVPGRQLGIGNSATYAQFIHNEAVRYVKQYIDRIFNYMPFLDSEYVRLINNIHDSQFYLVSDTLTMSFGNTDFSAYAEEMYDFLEKVRELENYNESINKKYAG